MRRADRLFQIVQRLRRRGVTTAAQLAEALEVSPRTVYRDIADLMASGVPVLGEAGVGYALPRGYDLPPLMFTEEEIEALVLGARAVRSWGDPALARAADDALGKIENVLPERLRHLVPESALFALGFHVPQQVRAGLGELRSAIRDRWKVRMAYADRGGALSRRIVWPLGLFYWGTRWSLGAWCELRQDFRNFRLDRVSDLELLDDRYPVRSGRTVADLMRHYEGEARQRRDGPGGAE
jgi:predicted DNA-binding transcriptional regulator YafY